MKPSLQIAYALDTMERMANGTLTDDEWDKFWNEDQPGYKSINHLREALAAVEGVERLLMEFQGEVVKFNPSLPEDDDDN